MHFSLLALAFDCREEIVFDILLWFLFRRLRDSSFDVELITCETCGEANILTTTTDSNALLVFAHEDFRALFFFVDFNLYNFSRAECVTDVCVDVLIERDDVDLFLITNFVHDRVHTRTMTADKCTNWINARNSTGDSELGATTSFACNPLDLHGTCLHFWNFLTEEILDKRFITSAEDELWATIVALDVFDKYLDAPTNRVEFTLDLLALWNDTGCFAELNTDDTRLNTLDDTSDDCTDFILKLRKDNFTLSFTETL